MDCYLATGRAPGVNPGARLFRTSIGKTVAGAARKKLRPSLPDPFRVEARITLCEIPCPVVQPDAHRNPGDTGCDHKVKILVAINILGTDGQTGVPAGMDVRQVNVEVRTLARGAEPDVDSIIRARACEFGDCKVRPPVSVEISRRPGSVPGTWT